MNEFRGQEEKKPEEMETLENKKQGCRHFCLRPMSHAKLWRSLISIIIALIIFSIGVSVGRHFNRERFDGNRKHYQSSGMMNYSGARSSRGGMMNRNNWSNSVQATQAQATGGNFNPSLASDNFAASQNASVSVFQLSATLLQVGPDRIVLTDNLGSQQVVFVQPNLVVLAGGQKVALASLKPGQNITVSGIVNANSQAIAQIINVQ